MAQCPQCADSPLVHTMLAEGFAAYSCGKCLGTLVSLVAYRAWRERAATGALRATPAARDSPTSIRRIRIGAKKCPKCRSLMSKYRISAGEDQPPRLLPALRGDLARRRRMGTGREPGDRG